MLKTRARIAVGAGALATLAAASILLAQSGLASSLRGSASPVGLDRPALGNIFFAPRFARAEIVVVGHDGQPQAVRIDRGRARAVSGTSVTLVERDGTVVTIPISPTALVRVNGRPGSMFEVRRNWVVMTARTGDGPADAVDARRAR